MLEQLLDALYQKRVDGTRNNLAIYLSDIEMHEIAPQVLSLLRQQPSQISGDLFYKIHGLYEKTVGQSLFVRLHQTKVLDILNREQIPTIPLKGPLFAQHYYGDFTARPTSDVDLLICHEHVERAAEALRSQGFLGPAPFNPLHFHCVMWKHVNSEGTVLYVELHWSLIKSPDTFQCWETFWRDAIVLPPYKYVRELSVQHTFYSICLHGANHRLSSLKYTLDVAHLLYRFGAEIDIPSLLDTCSRDGTLRRVRTVLNVVYRTFPTLHELKPLPYRVRGGRMIDATALRFPALMSDTWRHRLFLVKEWLIPRYEVARWYVCGEECSSPKMTYYRFYRQRCEHLFRRLGWFVFKKRLKSGHKGTARNA